MIPLTFSEIAVATKGVCEKKGSIASVFTDSRKVEKEGLFIALTGDKFDGHDFIKSLEGKGVGAVIVSKNTGTDIPEILVHDTSEALLDLAAYYRSRFNIPLIAVTGSVGKTITKDMTACVMSAKYNTLKTPENKNNTIGMPLTLLKLDNTYSAAVIEMGMNHLGEISALSKAARPTTAIITNIGTSHIEYLKTRENILKAKLEICDGMVKGSKLILNADNDLLQKVKLKDYETLFFSIKNNAELMAVNIEEKADSTEFVVKYQNKTQLFKIPTVGIHNVYDALSAIYAGICNDISLPEAAEALRSFIPSGMRQRIVEHKGITVIEDCYNASVDSVIAALDVLSSMKRAKKIAVLGDMLELGDYSATAHSFCGEYLAQKKIDCLLTYGNESFNTAKAAVAAGAPDVASFTDADALAKMLISKTEKGDAVLFKASRGMALENVLEKFYSGKE